MGIDFLKTTLKIRCVGLKWKANHRLPNSICCSLSLRWSGVGLFGFRWALLQIANCGNGNCGNGHGSSPELPHQSVLALTYRVSCIPIAAASPSCRRPPLGRWPLPRSMFEFGESVRKMVDKLHGRDGPKGEVRRDLRGGGPPGPPTLFGARGVVSAARGGWFQKKTKPLLPHERTPSQNSRHLTHPHLSLHNPELKFRDSWGTWW